MLINTSFFSSTIFDKAFLLRTRPRRLFDGATDEEEEEAVGKRLERREKERHEVPRMEKRNSKVGRDERS